MPNHFNHLNNVSDFYNKLSDNGKYATQIPNNKGRSKSKYVESVFTSALIPYFQKENFNQLLDFGCGTGVFSYQALKYVQHVIGVDISEKLINRAKGTYQSSQNISFQHIGGEKLPFSDNSFDIVVAREVICYVPDKQLPMILSEFYRVMKPGGKLLWLEQVSNNPVWQNNPASPHMTRRPPIEIKEHIKSAGFVLIEQKKVRTPRFPLIYMAWFRIVPQRIIPLLAQLEIAWHHQLNYPSKRWWNELFIIKK